MGIFGQRIRLAPAAATAIGLISAFVTMVPGTAAAGGENEPFVNRCRALAGTSDAVLGTITAAAPGAARFEERRAGMPEAFAIPQHCEIFGTFPARSGRHGQSYAIRYHMRLPAEWNGRFLFQGGAGTNGVVGDAMGWTGPGNAPGVVQGYAVVSQDSGHDNTTNSDPHWGGVAVFGSDPEARRNYGHASLPRVARAAKSVIARFYGSAPKHSYFFGCSKGGQEGMAFAQRYPEVFDGIVANAPGISLPRAGLAQTWDVQTFARLWPKGAGRIGPTDFASLFTPADFAVVNSAVREACDGLDGLDDGIIGAFGQCRSALVLSRLHAKACKIPAGNAACIASDKIAALDRSLSGPSDRRGRALYTTWPWDTGIGEPGWSLWKLGNSTKPSLNILTGGSALPTIFMVPPRAVGESPQALLDFQLAFRFPQDSRAITTTARGWPRSAWQDIAMRSPDLDRFRAHGGRLIIAHGVSDPVFSINDTLAWRAEVDRRYRGDANSVVRVFPVPGMTHCSGGQATKDFDAFGSLVSWVEKGKAPDRIISRAGPDTLWPGRTRPLCAWPKFARYRGAGSPEQEENFECAAM